MHTIVKKMYLSWLIALLDCRLHSSAAAVVSHGPWATAAGLRLPQPPLRSLSLISWGHKPSQTGAVSQVGYTFMCWCQVRVPCCQGKAKRLNRGFHKCNLLCRSLGSHSLCKLFRGPVVENAELSESLCPHFKSACSTSIYTHLLNTPVMYVYITSKCM